MKSNNGPIDVYLCPENNKENIAPHSVKKEQEDNNTSSTTSSSSGDVGVHHHGKYAAVVNNNGGMSDCQSSTTPQMNTVERGESLKSSCSFESAGRPLPCISSTVAAHTLATMNSNAKIPKIEHDDEMGDAGGDYDEGNQAAADLSISPLIPLEPNFKAEDYLFSLDNNEGIADLFDVDTFL